MDFQTELITTIHNPQYTYYKLIVNGVCQFDDFEKQIIDDPQYRKQYLNILAIMENITDQHQLTQKKFRQIKGVNRSDVYEFKSRDLRIYVVKKKPNIYVALAGFKKNQKADIKILKSKLKNQLI